MAYSARTHVAPGDLATAADNNQGMDNEAALYATRDEMLYVNHTYLTYSSDVAAHTCFTYALPGGTLGTTGFVVIRIFGSIKCTSANNNIVLVNLTYGGSNILTNASPGYANNYTDVFIITCVMSALNSASAQYANVQSMNTSSGVAIAGAFTTGIVSSSFASLAVNSAINQNIIFTMANGRNNADASWTYNGATVEKPAQ